MSNQINKQDIETFLNYLNHQTFWIHIFGAGKPNSSIKPQLYSKFHKDKNEIIEICKKYSNALTCVAINPRDENKTKINDIRRLDSLVIDIDVRKERRIKHISTNEDHKHAINKAYKIKEYLERNNFKVSLIVDSGNGSQVYLKLNQDFQTNFKNTNLYQQIINLENQLKSKFNDEIIEIDNITKDINRRIKIPGTINIKHEDQTEDRLSKILYFNKDYNQTTKQNQTSLNSYSSSPCEKKENKALSNNEILDKFQSLIKSHQYFNDLYNDKLTKTKFNNDRSRAEFTFLIWLVDYFQNFKEVNIIMNFCKIGRWKESNSNTKLLNFENAVKRLEYNKEQRQEETLNLWTPNDFKNLKKDDNFLIENVIYPKTITMLYSPPGEFKSIISVQMAINVAQGNTWMNFETQKNAVLYCDKENNDQIIKERLLGLIKGEEGSLEIPLFFLRREGDLLDKTFFKKLQNTISKNNIKLVFFDTLHRFADYDENRSDDINRFYTDVFQPLIEDYGISIIFLHHTTKEGNYRGSGDFLGMVDTAYKVKRKKKGKKKSNTFEIINEKSRSGEIENILGDIEFILDENENLDIIRINRLDEAKQEKEVKTKFKELVQKIETIIKPGELLQRKDFEERLEYEKFEYSLGTLKNVLSWMSRNDILIKDKRHRYKLPVSWEKGIEKGDVEVIDVT